MSRAFACAAVIFFALLGSSIAEEPADASTAIDRGLIFLAKDAVAWKEKHKCASCHHAGMIVWAMSEAQKKGSKVDETLLADLSKWMAESSDGRTTAEKPSEPAKHVNYKALWYGVGLSALNNPDEIGSKGFSHFLESLRLEQSADGSWISSPEGRFPVFGKSDFTVTALAALALSAAPETDSASKEARDRAAKWIASATLDDELQSLAMQLAVTSRLPSAAEQKLPLIEKLLSRQNPNGGWSQSKDLSSDAWATGQALYALSLAGVGSKNEAIARGKEFLVKTQREDGSWPMASRPTKPGGAGATNLVPITGAGTAWGVIGLLSTR